MPRSLRLAFWSGWRSPLPLRLSRIAGGNPVSALSIAVGLLLWQAVSLRFSHFILPPPSDVLLRLLNGAYLARILAATLAAVATMLLAFALAVAVAVPLGLLIGRSPRLGAAADPLVGGLYAVPPVALAPFVIIWCGLFWSGRLALIFLMCCPDMLVMAIAGARDIRQSLVAVGRSFGASRLQIARMVLLPAFLPFLFAALRVGVARAINGMITAELFLAAANLGGMLKSSAEAFDNTGVFAVVVLVCLLGLGAQRLVRLLEARALHWRGEPT